MEFGHDTIMGILLAAAGAVTIAYLTAASRPALRVLTLVGAAVTIVIGLLLFFGLA